MQFSGRASPVLVSTSEFSGLLLIANRIVAIYER
jgi:hypothetical protein